MDYNHLNRRQPNFAHQWVMWYGDYKYSQVIFHNVVILIIELKIWLNSFAGGVPTNLEFHGRYGQDGDKNTHN